MPPADRDARCAGAARGAVVWPTGRRLVAVALALVLSVAGAAAAGAAGLTTWDGRWPIERIEATFVYFVPADRTPLPDWRERVEYFRRRVESFHDREFGGRSRLESRVHPEPFVSAAATAALRAGDANRIYGRTIDEVAGAIEKPVPAAPDGGRPFPVLVVLSDVNWRPLDDFSRLAPTPDGWTFDGSISADGSHVPGSKNGGSRAVYLAEAGRGRGLVSGDGWRVPGRGSDCVVYHEGIGHAIGLPHPEQQDGSVMSVGQYRGWLSESWVEEGQKRRLGWSPPDRPVDRATDLFSRFRALPDPAVPRPGQPVDLVLEWPADVAVADTRVEIQTSLRGPWGRPRAALATAGAGDGGRIALGGFDRPCGVAYRARVATAAGDAAEVWGYFQVRLPDGGPPPPVDPDPTDRLPAATAAARRPEIDLLALVDPARDGVAGDWRREGEGPGAPLVSPRAFGARIEIPWIPPEEYRLTVIVEPLDEPRGLILGQRTPQGRFLVLVDFAEGDGRVGALENVDGRNVQANPTRVEGAMLERGRPAQIVCTVRRGGVEVTVDGRPWIDWRGDPGRLSLSDYWRTPRAETLFLGAYDCRHRFTRVTLEPLAGEGRPAGAPP